MQNDSEGRSDRQFRRNQTLSAARRYRDGETQSDRVRVHHLTNHRRKVGTVFLLIVGICAVLFALLAQFTARVSVSGADQPVIEALTSDVYADRIDAYLGMRPAERLRFLLNEQTLSDYVAAEYPEVASVAMSGVSGLTETRFRVELREPIASWAIDGTRSYVDTNGVVFEKNYFEDPGVQIVDRSGIAPEQGSTVASNRLLSVVGRIVSEAKGRGYTVTSVSLPANTTRQLEVRLKDQRPFIRFTTDREVGEQVEDMDRSLRFLRSENRSAQYIDVRVAGRAVYR